MDFVLSPQKIVIMMSLSAVFSGCVDPYYAPTTRYQPSPTRYYSSPAPRYVAPTPRYVTPTPVYVPQQAPTQVIVVPSSRRSTYYPSHSRDSDRMDRYDHTSRYRNSASQMDLQPQTMNKNNHFVDTPRIRNGFDRMDNRSTPMQNSARQMDNRVNPIVQPTPAVQPTQGQSNVGGYTDRRLERGDTNHRNGSDRRENHSMPMQNSARQMDNRVNPIVQPTPQPMVQPRIDNRPTPQPIVQPRIDNRPTFQPTPTVQPRPTPAMQPQPRIESRPTPMAQPTPPSTQPKKVNNNANQTPSGLAR